TAGKADIRLLLTGIGKVNADRAIRAAFQTERPGLVISSGFAGGLRPELEAGTVVYAAEPQTGLGPLLLAAGGRPAQFHCAKRVAATAAEKRVLWQSTGADAVEMESEVVCNICHAQNIPSATIRIILDTAAEDLPLDFNQLLDDEQHFDSFQLARALVKAPRKIRPLLRLQKQGATPPSGLAELLAVVLLKHRPSI